VYYQTLGGAPNRRFVVQWESTIYLCGLGLIDVRAVLSEGTNTIDVCYVDTICGSSFYDQGISATAGIQSGSGLSALQYSCNTTQLVDGLWLTYVAP
jgi:hypothetical protein